MSLGTFNAGIFNIGLVEFVALNGEANNSQNSRLILIGFCFGDFIVTMLWEFALNWFMSFNYGKFLENEDEKVIKKIKLNQRQKSMIVLRKDI